MEIEFTVHIDPEKRRHEGHAAISFVIAGTLALVLVALCCPPLWFPLLGIWVPMCFAGFHRFRSMRLQERQPDILRVEQGVLVYFSGGKKCFSIPLATIHRIESWGGLKIYVRGSKKITLFDPGFPLSKFLAKSRKHKCDLFFGWFDASAKARLQDIVHANQSYDSPSV
jgi:hypothetical protein